MKKFFCLALCLLLILSLTACFGKNSPPQTVSLMTQETIHYSDGVTAVQNYEYDERGNLIQAELNRGYDITLNYAYNALGYPTEIVEHSVLSDGSEFTDVTQYEYTMQGTLPKTCKVSTDGKEQYTCTFQTKKGLITRVDFESIDDGFCPLWHAYEYDKDGKLLKETYCLPLHDSNLQLYDFRQTRYEYDESGNLSALIREWALAFEENVELEKSDFQQQSILRFTRNDQGQLIALSLNDTTVSYTVTDSGISLPEGCENWEISEDGKVLSTDNRTYTYTTALLAQPDAERFHFADVLLRKFGSSWYGNTLLRLECLPEYIIPPESEFYYHMIPNPLV